ncbi:hypothetical protein B7486_76085, partial [cyanobacterium TDX16]
METASEPKAEDAFPLVSSEDFAQVEFERPLFGTDDVAAWRLGSTYLRAAREAETEQGHQTARVYRLLGVICDIHLRPEDRANIW